MGCWLWFGCGLTGLVLVVVLVVKGEMSCFGLVSRSRGVNSFHELLQYRLICIC